MASVYVILNLGAIRSVNLQLKLLPDADVSKGLFKHHTQLRGLINKLYLACTVQVLLHGSPPPTLMGWSILST